MGCLELRGGDVEAEGASGGRVLQAGSCLGTAPTEQKGVSPCPIHTLHPSVHLHHSPQTSPTVRAEISWQGIAFGFFFFFFFSISLEINWSDQ